MELKNALSPVGTMGKNFCRAFSELDPKAPRILGWLTSTQLVCSVTLCGTVCEIVKMQILVLIATSNDSSHQGDTACKLILKNKWLSCCRGEYTDSKETYSVNLKLLAVAGTKNA